MNAIDLVREYLYTNGFDIFDEELTSEGDKIYTVICARYTGIVQQFTEADLVIGKKLIEKSDPLLVRYIDKMNRQLETIISGMKKSQDKREDIERLLGLKTYFQKLTSNVMEGDKN